MFFDNLFDDFNPFGSYSYRQPRPQTSTTFRNDNRSIIVRKLLNDEYNYMCFDCHRELSELNFFDLKNGIFLCNNCAQHHARLSKEITQPMTGNLRLLEEKDLLLLYYGGNKNLFDFIQRYYPLLENMNAKEKYATKAMDYYRKLLRSKAYDEPEPSMPTKKNAYTSVFQRKVSPVREPTRTQRQQRENKNIRKNRMKDFYDDDENDENDDDNLGNIFRSTFFGDDLFNRNRRNEHKREREREEDEEEKDTQDDDVTMEPADVNKNETDEIDDAGMKVEKRENSVNRSNKKQEKIEMPKTERTINTSHIHHQPKFKKIEKKQNKKIETKETDNKINVTNGLTINQIGELSSYPDAMEIDGMECECS